MKTPLQIIATTLGSHSLAVSCLEALAACGYVCVPEKPTQAMLDAAWGAAHAENAADTWKEMIEEFTETSVTAACTAPT